MARRKNPLGGSPLNKLGFFKSKPINRDARKLVEPLDPVRKQKVKPTSKTTKPAKHARSSKPALTGKPRKQLFKKDGTVVEAPGDKA